MDNTTLTGVAVQIRNALSDNGSLPQISISINYRTEFYSPAILQRKSMIVTSNNHIFPRQEEEANDTTDDVTLLKTIANKIRIYCESVANDMDKTPPNKAKVYAKYADGLRNI